MLPTADCPASIVCRRVESVEVLAPRKGGRCLAVVDAHRSRSYQRVIGIAGRDGQGVPSRHGVDKMHGVATRKAAKQGAVPVVVYRSLTTREIEHCLHAVADSRYMGNRQRPPWSVLCIDAYLREGTTVAVSSGGQPHLESDAHRLVGVGSEAYAVLHIALPTIAHVGIIEGVACAVFFQHHHPQVRVHDVALVLPPEAQIVSGVAKLQYRRGDGNIPRRCNAAVQLSIDSL